MATEGKGYSGSGVCGADGRGGVYMTQGARLPRGPSANEITAQILLGVSARFKGQIILWRNNRIDAMAVGRGGKLRKVSAGINGQGDICGLMACSGRMIQIEVKAGRDSQSDVQIGFQRMIIGAGGIYIIARDADRCLEELAAYLASSVCVQV